MKWLHSALAGALLLGASSLVFGECSRPAEPNIPNGATASLDEMKAGQKSVQAYVASTEAYLECRKAEEEKEDISQHDEENQLKIMAERTDRHNAVVDDMQALAERFNMEVREYKAKTATPDGG